MTLRPPRTAADTTFRFWLYHGVIPAVLFLASLLSFALTPLDISISDRLFDFDAQRWIFEDAWWTNELIHDGGRAFIAIVGLLLLVTLTLSFANSRMRRWRRKSLYICLVMGVSTGLIGWARQESKFYCPWDVDHYGGFAPHLGWMDPLPPGLTGGQCFPAGHAASAYSLIGLYFVGRERNRRWAYAGLGAALLLGSIFALGQMLRGAHFISHNVWTLAICWAVAVVLYKFAFHGVLGGGVRNAVRGTTPASV